MACRKGKALYIIIIYGQSGAMQICSIRGHLSQLMGDDDDGAVCR